MKRFVLVLTLICMIGFCACHSDQDRNVLVSRSFPTSSWERFDFVEKNFNFSKPVTYDLTLSVTFAPNYPYDYFAMSFNVFDEEGHPLRSKNYQFPVKDRNGSWKSEVTEDGYRFTFPINNELTLNEPGKYKFQIENRMPITPLLGIKEIALIGK